MGQGVRTGLGHGGITCVLQTQFSSLFFAFFDGIDAPDVSWGDFFLYLIHEKSCGMFSSGFL